MGRERFGRPALVEDPALHSEAEMSAPRLQPRQVDALRELVSIGAGHAATALSELTRRRVRLIVPDVRVVPAREVETLLGAPDRLVAAVTARMLGDLSGRTVQLFDGPSARCLADLLLKSSPAGFPEGFGAEERAVLERVSATVTDAYLTAVAGFLGVMAMTALPEFAIDTAAAVLLATYVNSGDANDHVLHMSTRLELEGATEGLQAHLLLVPDQATLSVILRLLRLA
jgi:chemotaxis protein CheC